MGEDKSGSPVIYFRAKTVLRIKRLEPIYEMMGMGIMNKIDLQTNGNGFTNVFDLTQVKLKNVNLNLLEFAIKSLRKYFPLSVTAIIVYNLPWYLKGGSVTK